MLLLLFSQPAPKLKLESITISNYSGAPTTTFTVNMPGPDPEDRPDGDHYVFLGFYNNLSVDLVPAAGWTEEEDFGPAGHEDEWAWKVGSSEPASYVFTLSGGVTAICGMVLRFSGVDPDGGGAGDPIHAKNSSSGSDASSELGSVATAAARSILIATASGQGAVSITGVPSGYDQQNTDLLDRAVGLFTKFVGPGTWGGTVPWSGANSWNSVQIALAELASPPVVGAAAAVVPLSAYANAVHGVSGSAAGTIQPTADAAGDHGVAGSASASISPTVSAAGDHGVSGSAAATVLVTVSAAGVHGVTGTGAGAVAPAASAAGDHGVTGSAAATVEVAAAASGDEGVTGTAAGVVSVVASAAGVEGVAGSAAAVVAVTADASGEVEPPDDAVTGSAAAVVAVSAAASGVHGVSGSADAQVAPIAAASGAHGVTAAGAGLIAPAASGSGTVGVSGSAAATVTLTAAASGQVGITGAAVATVQVVASGTGAALVTGTAAAVVPVTAAATGQVGTLDERRGGGPVRWRTVPPALHLPLPARYRPRAPASAEFIASGLVALGLEVEGQAVHGIAARGSVELALVVDGVAVHGAAAQGEARLELSAAGRGWFHPPPPSERMLREDDELLELVSIGAL